MDSSRRNAHFRASRRLTPPLRRRQLRWHELYLQYTSLIEGKLESFLKEEGVPVAALLSAASGETDGSYTCIDYLVASTE